MNLSKITNVSLKERVISELENKILSGELQPGDRLPPERELALVLGTSRSLVNLCILELESRGFVSIVPRQGTFVNDYKKQGTPQILLSLMNYGTSKMDWVLFDNMMDTRRLIEFECTRLAVKNATNEDYELLQKALDLMEQNITGDDFFAGNFSFHHALTAASGNAVYAMIFNSFEKAICYFFRLYFNNADRRLLSLLQHRALFQALLNRDETAALEAIRLTLDTGVEGLSHVFKQ